jgi:tetratricopeptide (TPR) repeat protein
MPRPLDADTAAGLFRETDGNPLFVIEAVRAGWQPGAREGESLTPRVQAVIRSRLGQLSETAREVVSAAATLGREFTIDTLAPTADISVEEAIRALDELWRTRLVRDGELGTYDFSHDKIREVAYLDLSPPARRGYHLRAALTLKQRHANDPLPVSGQIAAHYDRAGIVDEAITWYETAAEASQRLYASQEAVRLLMRALDLVQSLPAAPERHARELAIITALLTPVASAHGFASRELDELQRASVDLTQRLGVDLPPQVIRSLAISSLSRDEFETARRHGEQLRVRGTADGDDALLVESEYVLGIAAFWKGELVPARRHFEAAVAGYRPDRRRAHLLRYWLDPQVVSLSRLGNTLWLLGDATAARRARDDALALADSIAHRPSRRTALVFAAMLAVDTGDADEFRQYLAALEAGLDEHDARPTRASTAAFRSYARVLDGDLQPGIAAIRAAVDELSGGGDAPGHRAMVARLLLAAHDIAREPRGRLAAAEYALSLGGASLWESEAHRARAESLASLDADAAVVRAAFDRAIAVARRQGALMLELRATAGRDRYLGVTSGLPPGLAPAAVP